MYCFGKRPARPPVLPYLSHYAAPGSYNGLPTPPPQAHYGVRVKTPLRMDGNGPDPEVTIMGPNFQGVGDCAWAMADNLLNTSNALEYEHVVTRPTPDQVVEAYCQYLGCTPAQLAADPSLDQGTDLQEQMQQWLSTPYFGTTIAAFAPVNVSNMDEVRFAIAFAGGLCVGIQIQQAQEQQFPHPWVWQQGSPILGGHAIFFTGYDEKCAYLDTWGASVAMPWSTFPKLADEAYVVITPEMRAALKGPNPRFGATAIDLAALESDIQQLDA